MSHSAPESILFYQPSLLGDPDRQRSAWSHSICTHGEGLLNAVAVRWFHGQPGSPDGMSLAIAGSRDGVHWRETHASAAENPASLAGYCLREVDGEIIYYNSELNRGDDRTEYPVILRQYRTIDGATWEWMGEACTTRPDRRWYRCRWDELVILEDAGRYYGYITSEPHPHLATDSLGMLQSTDALYWETMPPPVIEWGDLPPQQMEVCFCERIGDRYYLGMGARCYMGHLGFSVMTFVAERPAGPFRPDRDAFRLCGSTLRDVNWLAKTFRWRGELLLSNWITPGVSRRFPGIYGNGESLLVGPLKRLITDGAGHARIAWWPGNEAARGAAIPLDLPAAALAHPPAALHESRASLTSPAPDAAELTAGHDGAIVLLPAALDLRAGVMFEGELCAAEPRGHIGTHWHAAAAGIFFEEAPGRGTLVQMETLGLTRIGLFEHAPTPAYDADEFRLAAWGNTQRGGDYLGLSRFTPEDVVGPLGYAAPAGIRHGRTHSFRVIVARGVFELYLDDLLVQSYPTGPTSGRLGLFARAGSVRFQRLRLHRLA